MKKYSEEFKNEAVRLALESGIGDMCPQNRGKFNTGLLLQTKLWRLKVSHFQCQGGEAILLQSIREDVDSRITLLCLTTMLLLNSTWTLVTTQRTRGCSTLCMETRSK